MQHYELTVLGRTEDALKTVTALIQAVGGTLTSEQQLGQRRLVYPINKERAAFFGVYQFDCEPKKILELNKKILGTEELLRHLIIAGGIRLPIAKTKKLSAKDLEVPESLTKGMAELAKEAEATATAAELSASEANTPESGIQPPSEPETAKTENQKLEDNQVSVKKIAISEPTPATTTKKTTKAEELTAQDRQEKLDEKLKSILGE